MKRNDGLDAAPGNLFTDGDPAVPIAASVLDASWLNMVQEEISNVVEGAGLVLSALDDTQLLQAINIILNAKFAGAFKVYAGNPNGFVSGTQGVAGGAFPTVCWDVTNNIWWVCTTTGNAAAALWTQAMGGGSGITWLGVATGTAAAQVIAATPASLTAFPTGTAIAWQVSAGPNIGAVTLQVGAFGTFSLFKDAPAGPTALTGGELAVGSIVTARFNGVNLQLVDTALGTASLANASSNTGVVAAVAGAIVAGNIAEFNDAAGTVRDSGATVTSLLGGAEATFYRLGLVF